MELDNPVVLHNCGVCFSEQGARFAIEVLETGLERARDHLNAYARSGSS